MARQKSAILTSPAAPSLLKFRRLASSNKFQEIFSTGLNSCSGRFLDLQQSIGQTIEACVVGTEHIEQIEPISKGAIIQYRFFSKQVKRFHACQDALKVLSCTTNDSVGHDTQLALISMLGLLSAMLVHNITLLDKKWLHRDKSDVFDRHSWIEVFTRSLLSVDVPWDGNEDKAFRREELRLREEQRDTCKSIISHGCFNELGDLIVTLEKHKYWERLVWTQRQDATLQQSMRNISRLLQKITDICKKADWEGLQRPLPSVLSLAKSKIKDAAGQADFNLGWVNSAIATEAANWVGPRTKIFELGEDYPALGGSWGDTGLWLMKDRRYREWFESCAGSTNRYLWYLGGIGMGKSVLMHLITERHLHKFKNDPIRSRPILVRLHFHEDKQFGVLDILAEILQQIFTQVKVPTNLMVLIYEQAFSGNTMPCNMEYMYSLLQEFTATYTVYFFLDAIDECDIQTSQDVIHTLSSLGPTTHVICFSRPAPNLSREIFPQFEFSDLHGHRSDLEHCLLNALDLAKWKDKNPFLPGTSKTNSLLAKVLEPSQGGFLLLANQLMESSFSTEKGLLDAVSHIPDTVYERYRQTMYRVRGQLSANQDTRTLDLMAWVAVVPDLSVSRHLLQPGSPFAGIGLPEILRIVQSTLGILVVADDQVRFSSHPTELYVTQNFWHLFPNFVSAAKESLNATALHPAGTFFLESLNEFIIKHELIYGSPINHSRSGAARGLQCDSGIGIEESELIY